MHAILITHTNNMDNKLSSTLWFKFSTFYSTSIHIKNKSKITTILNIIHTSIIKYV